MKLVRISPKRFMHVELASADPARTMVVMRSGPCYQINLAGESKYRVEMTREEALEVARRLVDLADRE